MSEITPEKLANYFAIREEQRQQDIAESLPVLERQMTAFLEHSADDGHLGAYIARMIRETAVAAYVRGNIYGGGTGKKPPRDSVMLFEALETVRSHDDLYPAWRMFDRRSDDEETENA